MAALDAPLLSAAEWVGLDGFFSFCDAHLPQDLMHVEPADDAGLAGHEGGWTDGLAAFRDLALRAGDRRAAAFLIDVLEKDLSGLSAIQRRPLFQAATLALFKNQPALAQLAAQGHPMLLPLGEEVVRTESQGWLLLRHRLSTILEETEPPLPMERKPPPSSGRAN